MATRAERNLAAEVRAVEEGHRAFVQDDGSVHVVSDNFPHEKHFKVTYSGVGSFVHFHCRPIGFRVGEEDHGPRSTQPGTLPCKHAALAVRRLEREGFATMTDDGMWHVTPKAVAAAEAAFRARTMQMSDEDVFKGL